MSVSTSHLRKRAKIGYEECIQTMIESDDREQRELAANKLMMYYAHLKDLEREVPSSAMIEWWDDLQRDLSELFSPGVLLDEETRKKKQKHDRVSLGTLLQRHRDRAKLIFAGQKCELLAVSTFDVQKQPAKFYPGQAINYSISGALRILSDKLYEVYGLEQLDIPQQVFCAETPLEE